MAEGHAQILQFLYILERSAITAKLRWVGAKEGHDFGLVHIQHQPFHSRVGVESVELELDVLGSIGSKCSVVSVFRVGDFVCLQGCHCNAIIPWQGRTIHRIVKHQFKDFKDPPQNGSWDAPILLCFAPC